MKRRTSKQAKQTKQSDYTSSHAAKNTPTRAVMEKVTLEPAPVAMGSGGIVGEDRFPEGAVMPALGLIVPEGTGTPPVVRAGGAVA